MSIKEKGEIIKMLGKGENKRAEKVRKDGKKEGKKTRRKERNILKTE